MPIPNPTIPISDAAAVSVTTGEVSGISIPPASEPTLASVPAGVVPAASANITAAVNLPRPATIDARSIMWGYLFPVAAFHLLLPLAFVPWLFSWTGLLLVPLGNFVFCSMGIGAGFHRLLTHRGYRCPLWFERLLSVLGVCCLQDTPARWVAIHRMHHQHSDEQPDPHSPLVSFLWGHMGWLLVENRELSKLSTYEKYARDVLADPFNLWFERRLMWAWVYVAHAVLFFMTGLAIGWVSTGVYWSGVQFGLSLLLWGVIFRTVYTWHITWAINSAAHRWGYRNYETDENSRNNWLCALATNGEGWHNNHHADPRSARHGHRWWELDITWLSLRILERIGIVHDLVHPHPRVYIGPRTAAADGLPAARPRPAA